jgi:hypothetical protein
MPHPSHFLLIIGSPKAGTTSLARWLGSRTDMALGTWKEPRYFTDFGDHTWTGPGADGFQATIITEETAYFENFAHCPQAGWAIDASTDYLWRSEAAVEKIQGFAQRFHVKLICLTRDPVKRAVSEYNHTLAANMEILSFRESLNTEAERSAKGCHPLFRHQRRSRIQADLRRYADTFGTDLLVLDHDLLADPHATNETVSRFLGVPTVPFKDTGIYNERQLPRNALARRIMNADELKRLGRRVVPKALRHAVWTGLQAPSRKVSTVSEDEIAYARTLLADEIERCVADPLIDTSTWTLALKR